MREYGTGVHNNQKRRNPYRAFSIEAMAAGLSGPDTEGQDIAINLLRFFGLIDKMPGAPAPSSSS